MSKTTKLHRSCHRTRSTANSNLKVGGFHEPEVLRAPLLDVSMKVEVADQSGNQLGHLQNGDMFSETCPGAQTKLLRVSMSYRVQGQLQRTGMYMSFIIFSLSGSCSASIQRSGRKLIASGNTSSS